jgi:hypothetical protein
VHGGQFAAGRSAGECGACHRETGFKPSTFTPQAHDQSRFPLEGKHAPLPCAKCHEPAGRETVYHTGKLVCSACHEDRHAGQFAAAPINNRCEVCHSVEGFPQTAFTVARHAETRFPLAGRHAAVACAECHKPRAAGGPRQYRFDVLTCATCHADPHDTRTGCEACHTPEAWKTVLRFDHATTRFRLEGAHLDVKCAQCHLARPTQAAASGSAPRFSGASQQCFSCHQTTDVHAAQFRKDGPVEDCSACHGTAQWKSVTFTHDRARFALDVAHRNVACARCHKERAEANGKPARQYRGTPVQCVQCH